MKKYAGLLALMTIAGTTAARAQGMIDWYGGASVGSTHNGSNSPQRATDRSDTSYKLYGGYRFHPAYALEFGYVDLGRFDTATGSLKSTGVFVDAVTRWPMLPRLSAIAKIGLFNGSLRSEDSLNGDAKDRGTYFKVGAGIEYQLSKHLFIRGEWERYKLNTSIGKPGVDNYTMGLQLRF
jgi:OmpA-OmpF porin, OOP family